MNYQKIDKNFAYKRMYDLIKKECPNKTEAFYQLVAEQRVEDGIRFWLKEYLSDKLQKTGTSNPNGYDKMANKIIEDLPEELFPNIYEWLNDEPISEIDYGGISIKRIMEYHKELFYNKYAFLRCVNIIKHYIKSGCKDKEICYEPSWVYIQ